MNEQLEVIVHGQFYQNDSITSRRLSAKPGDQLLVLLKKNGYYMQDCNGRGTCGKCRIRFLSPAPLPTAVERVHLKAEELRAGYRLACRQTVRPDMEFVLAMEPAALPKVVLDEGTDECSADGENVGDEAYFIAVDIGTTTVAMQAVQNGCVQASFTAMNPQRVFGADVASRILAGMQGKLHELSVLIRECIGEGVESIAGQLGRKAEYLVIAGNTTMNYLFRELPVEVLGAHPFGPIDTRWLQTKLCGIKAYLIPGISAFVGGDIVAGLIANGMYQEQGIRLLLDLGTNGEMVLGQKDRMIGTATAAGPAFEGGISSQMMGADLIRMTAELLNEGILDETGLLREPYFSDGVRKQGVLVKNEDIRELQKAKAAIATGIDLLLTHYGISYPDVEQIYLAGGFGYYLDPESAVRIGLLPEAFRGRIRAVGNSSLAGAKLIGSWLRNDADISKMIENIRKHCEVINLAMEPAFADKYVENMNFWSR